MSAPKWTLIEAACDLLFVYLVHSWQRVFRLPDSASPGISHYLSAPAGFSSLSAFVAELFLWNPVVVTTPDRHGFQSPFSQKICVYLDFRSVCWSLQPQFYDEFRGKSQKSEMNCGFLVERKKRSSFHLSTSQSEKWTLPSLLKDNFVIHRTVGIAFLLLAL